MAARQPRFFSQPFRYLRWTMEERPAWFWSCFISALGPIMVVMVPPIRNRLGDGQRPVVPMTYPIPRGPRKKLDGYDDP